MRKTHFGLAALLAMFCMVGTAFSHGVAGGDQAFMIGNKGVSPVPFMYLGAKHMVTGYDHILYLACVIFFLQKLTDVVKFVSLFTIGHSLTLLFGVLSGTHVNPFFVDAFIGLSVCYKALENLGTLRLLDPKLAVFGFGLVHGFGLSSKLQDLSFSPDGLIANMIFFNIGVEVGQALALVVLFFLFNRLRKLKGFAPLAQNANVALFGAGLVLFGFQITGLSLT